MNDQQVMGLLRENLERLDPAPATDPALLAARRRALIGGDGGGGRQVQADDTQWLALEELTERLAAIRREAAAHAPVAVPTDSGVGGPPVGAGSHMGGLGWLPAARSGAGGGRRVSVPGVPATHPPTTKHQPPLSTAVRTRARYGPARCR